MHVNSNAFEMFSCNPELIRYECTQLNCIFYIMYIMYNILLQFDNKDVVRKK